MPGHRIRTRGHQSARSGFDTERIAQMPHRIGRPECAPDPHDDGDRRERRDIRHEPLGIGSLPDLEKGDGEERAAIRAQTGTQTPGRRFRLVADEERDRDDQFHQKRRRQHDTHGRHLAQGHGGPDGENSEADPVGDAGETSGITGHDRYMEQTVFPDRGSEMAVTRPCNINCLGRGRQTSGVNR